MITIYFDFLCPFAWRGLELINVLQKENSLAVTLKHFSLEQGNHADNAGKPRHQPLWRLEQQAIDQTLGLKAFLASHAAKQQGSEAQMRFALELFRLRHQHKADLNNDQTHLDAAQKANLDLKQFQNSLKTDDSLRQALAQDLHAAGEVGVFGTPTFVLPSDHAAYFRFANLVTDPKEALVLWDMYVKVLESEANIETIKRPRK